MTVFAGETAYLFSYFINDSKDGLHLAYSYDGLNWLPLHGGRSYLTPAVGKDKLMRDPSICQSPDGTFHMVWTSSWTDRIIGYASSRDLVHWSEQQAIPVMMHEPDAHNCWAPELFYDEPSQTYYIFWATTIPGRHKEVATSESEKGLNHRIYYVTTKDFRTFSKTKMFFNPDFSVIDAAIVKDPTQGDLIMVVKNENSNPPEKNLRVTRTKNIAKGFPTSVDLRSIMVANLFIYIPVHESNFGITDFSVHYICQRCISIFIRVQAIAEIIVQSVKFLLQRNL